MYWVDLNTQQGQTRKIIRNASTEEKDKRLTLGFILPNFIYLRVHNTSHNLLVWAPLVEKEACPEVIQLT